MNGRMLLRRNLVETLGRFAALLGAIVIGAAVVLAVSGAIGGDIARFGSNLDTGSALTVIEMYSSNGPNLPSRPLTAKAIDAIRGIGGVGDVRIQERFPFVVLDAPGIDAVVMMAVPRASWVQPAVIEAAPGTVVDRGLQETEVYFPDRARGQSHRSLLGRSVAIQYNRTVAPGAVTGEETRIRVVGLYDNSNPDLDGEFAVYVSDALSRRMLGAALGLAADEPIPEDYAYTKVYVKAASTRELARVKGELRALGFLAHSLAAKERELPAVLRLASWANDIFGALLFLLCAGAGFALGSDWSRQRRWDVGLLAALGWSRARVAGLFGGEILIVGLTAGLAGAILGAFASLGLGSALSGQDFWGVRFNGGLVLPPALWLLTVFGGVPVALLLGAAPRIVRLAGLPPDVALRRMG